MKPTKQAIGQPMTKPQGDKQFRTWGDVFTHWRRQGEDLAYCAVKADQWERKQKEAV